MARWLSILTVIAATAASTPSFASRLAAPRLENRIKADSFPADNCVNSTCAPTPENASGDQALPLRLGEGSLDPINLRDPTGRVALPAGLLVAGGSVAVWAYWEEITDAALSVLGQGVQAIQGSVRTSGDASSLRRAQEVREDQVRLAREDSRELRETAETSSLISAGPGIVVGAFKLGKFALRKGKNLFSKFRPGSILDNVESQPRGIVPAPGSGGAALGPSIRPIDTGIIQGLTRAQTDEVAAAASALARRHGLTGELAFQGSRVRGGALPPSDLDFIVRVDDETFEALGAKLLADVHPESVSKARSLRKAIRRGQLSSFDLGKVFADDRRSTLDPLIPFKKGVDYSVVRIGSKLDTGPFMTIENL